MNNDDYDGQMIFGDLVGLKLPDIFLTGEEKSRNTSLSKLFPTGDRTRTHCVTGVHATACSTAVDATQEVRGRSSGVTPCTVMKNNGWCSVPPTVVHGRLAR